jgi:hypothetical protein
VSIQKSFPVNLFSGPTIKGNLDLNSTTIESNYQNHIWEDLLVRSLSLTQLIDLLFRDVKFFHYGEATTVGSLDQVDSIISTNGSLGIFDFALFRSTQLSQVIGDTPININDFRRKIKIIQRDGWSRKTTELEAKGTQTEVIFNLPLFEIHYPTYTDTLELVDELGPEIFNEVPSFGSSFNDPSTTISFDLIDTGNALITPSSIQFFINDNPIVSAGVDVTNPAYGTTTFTKVNDSFYTFEFIPVDPFPLGSVVTLSGQAADNIPPTGNLSLYNYTFQVWASDTLFASINGLPDVDPPILDNYIPLPYESDIPVDTNISFDLYDIHTGVNFNSVVISVGDKTLISGGNIYNTDFAIVTQTPIYGTKGKNYDINLVEDLPFGAAVSVTVYAEDLFSPPNILDTGYEFYTQPNAHLVVTDLNVYQPGGYEEMFIGQSYITEPTTQLYIDFINTLETPIDIDESYIELNGSSIPFTPVSISGGYYYRIFFDLEPEYDTDANLLFHVQQSGTTHGNIVYKNYTTNLLWGYQVCYDKQESFNFDRDIVTTISVRDQGDYYTVNYLLNKFTTTPMRSNRLNAYILGVKYPHLDLSGYYSSNNPFHEYGKTMNLLLEVEDFAGNKLSYSWNYKIEEKN